MLSTISKQNKAQPQASAAQAIELTEALGRADALLQKYEQRGLPDARIVQASASQSAALVRMPDVDDLANFIRFTDGNHKMGAGALAERIVDWLSAPSAAQSAPAGEREGFAREDRYTVIKHKDLVGLPRELLVELRLVLDRLSEFTPKREYVVVESDWPEYEPVWRMIENRATSSFQKSKKVRANEK